MSAVTCDSVGVLLKVCASQVEWNCIGAQRGLLWCAGKGSSQVTEGASKPGATKLEDPVPPEDAE